MTTERKHWKVNARLHWLAGVTITESYNPNDDAERRFTATISGYRNWKIIQGYMTGNTVNKVISKVKAIRSRIEANDESVFTEPNIYETA